MTEKYKLGRTLATQTAFNSKSTAWLTKQFEVKQAHNFRGSSKSGFIERFEYKNNKVTTYDISGKEIDSKERTKKVQNISKLSKSTDDKLRKPTE